MAELLIILTVAMVGASFGSFVSAVSYRLPREEDIVVKPSFCPGCGHTLAWNDLIPLLSWLWQRGKCRYCAMRVSPRYPFIEAATMLLFLLLLALFGLSAYTLLLMAMSVVLMVMIVTDLEHYIIPDSAQVALLLLGIAYIFLLDLSWRDALIGATTGGGIGLALAYGYRWLRKRDGLGFGDVKFLFVAGLWLGTMNLVPFLFLSGLIGTLLALLWRALGRGEVFPFGPALAVTLFIVTAFPPVTAFFWEISTHIAELLV